MSKELPPVIDPFDDCPWLPARTLFRRLGYEPLPPSAVDDFQLSGRLWEFIYALAGRRFWLNFTDHLSERELYAWLHDVWFERDVADIPPEAEWNCRMDPAEDDFNCGRFPTVWLRFFADEADRAEYALHFPDEAMPPRQTPPFNRDRWLPEPFYPPTDSDAAPFPFEEEGDFTAEDHRSEADPLGLEAADAAIEANQRREQARLERAAREAEEDEHLAAISGGESQGWRSPIRELQRAGSLLPPDELTDDTLHGKLWELLHNLACRGYYVLNTDQHLHFSLPELPHSLEPSGRLCKQ